MIEIALFDTDPSEQYQLDDILTAIMFSRDDFNITFYSSYTFFSCDMAQNKRVFDILFVNVSTPDNAGLMAAESARKLSSTIEIVMIAYDYSYLKLGYRVKALDYVLKPYNKAQLTETIDRFYSFFERDNSFSYKCGSNLERIKLDNILYMVSNGRKINIITVGNRVIEFYGKLDGINEMLSAKGFVRIHQSYLVNIKFVKCVARDKLLVDNDDELPVSRNRFDMIKDAFVGDEKVG